MLGFLLAGCGQKPANNPDPIGQIDVNAEDYPYLQEQLFQLAVSEKREPFAALHRIDYEAGEVIVAIEYSRDAQEDIRWAVQALSGEIQVDLEGTMQARLTLNAMLELARHPRINFVRAPVRVR